MSAIDPFEGFRYDVGNVQRWELVTPHATNFLEGDVNGYNVAVAIRTVDGGVVAYENGWGNSKTIELLAGDVLPMKFTKVFVSGTTATKIYAGFIGEEL